MIGLAEAVFLRLERDLPRWVANRGEGGLSVGGELKLFVPVEEVTGRSEGGFVTVQTEWDPIWRGRFLVVSHQGKKERHLLMNDGSKAWDTDYLQDVPKIVVRMAETVTSQSTTTKHSQPTNTK